MPRARRTPASSTMVTEQVVVKCPACHQDITAKVTVAVHMGDPVIAADGSVTVPHESEMIRYNVSHQCHGPDADSVAEPPEGGEEPEA